MKKIVLSLSLVFVLSIQLIRAQDTDAAKSYRPIQFFIGLQPAVEMEWYDEFRKTIDVNLIPLQLEYAVNQKWSIRLAPEVYMQFRPEFPRALSRVGTGLTVPYHFSKKNSEEGHRGFYVGPHGAFAMHRLDNFMSTTLAAEIGYYFLFNSIFSVNIGAQAGRTLMMDPNGSYNFLVNHTAAVLAFGFWF